MLNLRKITHGGVLYGSLIQTPLMQTPLLWTPRACKKVGGALGAAAYLGLHLMWLSTTGERLHAAGIGD